MDGGLGRIQRIVEKGRMNRKSAHSRCFCWPIHTMQSKGHNNWPHDYYAVIVTEGPGNRILMNFLFITIQETGEHGWRDVILISSCSGSEWNGSQCDTEFICNVDLHFFGTQNHRINFI